MLEFFTRRMFAAPGVGRPFYLNPSDPAIFFVGSGRAAVQSGKMGKTHPAGRMPSPGTLPRPRVRMKQPSKMAAKIAKAAS